jgi:hypothetical protein
VSKEEMKDDTELKIQRYGIDKIKIMITQAFRINYDRLKDVTVDLRNYFEEISYLNEFNKLK